MCSVLVFSQGGLLELGMRLVWVEASMSLCPSWGLLHPTQTFQIKTLEGLVVD